MNSNDISATEQGVTIVAIVAVIFCLLGAVILFFYNEKKVMATIEEAHLAEGLPEDTKDIEAVEEKAEEAAPEVVEEATAEEVKTEE